MCTGISNVMETNVAFVNASSEKPVENSNITPTRYTPYYQEFHLGHDFGHDFENYQEYPRMGTYWLNINITTASINDDTQQHNVSADSFRYPYSEILSIPNNLLF